MPNPRTTIIFTEPQWDYLEQEAARWGISIGEVVRRIIDQHRIKPTAHFPPYLNYPRPINQSS